MKRINIPLVGSFDVDSDETILEAGLRASFSFPAACRNGVCERCQGTLLKGSVHIARKDHTIHAGETDSTRVLYCLAHALTDCEISVPDIRAPGELPVHEVTCQITEITPLSDDVSRVMLRLPAGKVPRWHAGQYLELLFPFGDCAFSIANAPSGRDLELHVRYHHENSSSLDVIAALQNDSLVKVRLPGGTRHLAALPERPIWLICGSTGFAPIKAMLEHLRNERFRLPIHLYWGARTQADMYLADAAKALDAELPNLKYIPALSEEQRDGFFFGLIHEAVLKDLHTPAEPIFYVGGSPPMAWAVFDALVDAGVPAEHIHSDVYDYAPRAE
jgi:CDP-4-dehydro-6-deoxyglucose reductase